jgi:hypothetical protein
MALHEKKIPQPALIDPLLTVNSKRNFQFL